MELNEYQEKAMKTAMGPALGTTVYPALGLAGETGEVVEKIKKLMRDKGVTHGEETLLEDRLQIALELGDVLWYLTVLARNLGLDLNQVAEMNLEKLKSRKDRGQLGGEGDTR